MTPFRIHATARPATHNGPLRPMSREDASFWRLRAERKALAAAKEPRP